MTREPQEIHSALADKTTSTKPAAANGAAQAVTPADLSPDTRPQYAALCWRKSGRKVEILMVTSRDTGRWIIPKGWPIAGLTPAEAAAREAHEEAGAEGAIGADSIGHYSYDKTFDTKPPVPCLVTVFPLKVRRLLDRFPERDQRDRKWFTPQKAATLVAEPELRDLLRAFTPQSATPPKTRAPKGKA